VFQKEINFSLSTKWTSNEYALYRRLRKFWRNGNFPTMTFRHNESSHFLPHRRRFYPSEVPSLRFTLIRRIWISLNVLKIVARLMKFDLNFVDVSRTLLETSPVFLTYFWETSRRVTIGGLISICEILLMVRLSTIPHLSFVEI